MAEFSNPHIVVSLYALRALRDLIRATAEVARSPETRALPVITGFLVFTGTMVYWRTEGWTIIESFYFSVMTLTTIGYGDLTPTTPGTQIFTVIYVLIGIGVLLALLTSVAQAYIKQKAEAPGIRERLREHRHHGEEE